MEKVSTYDEITHFFGMLSNLFEVVTTVTGLNILEDALDQVEAILLFCQFFNDISFHALITMF